jgi:hypothetical protein
MKIFNKQNALYLSLGNKWLAVNTEASYIRSYEVIMFVFLLF